MQKLTDRQIKILKIIAKEYSSTGTPISSKLIANLFSSKISSQTIRNELAELEKLGYLEKIHTSSGRVPSKSGLEFFNECANEMCISTNIEKKLESIFIKRESDIDSVINDSLVILNEITSLPSIANTYFVDESLREVNLVQLNDVNSLMLIVTNLGNIYKNYIEINNQERFEDTKVCIGLFNKFLIGTKLINLESKIQEILPIIKEEVNEYEYITREIIKKLFDYTFKNVKKTNVVGMTSLFQYPEFSDPEILCKLINMLETGNIWKQIKHVNEQEKKQSDVKIEFRTSNNNNPKQTIMIASTSIKIGNQQREISVVGPSRVEFGQIKGILNFLKSRIEEIYNDNHKK